MEGRLGAFDLVGQLVKTLRRRRGSLLQLFIVRQAVILQVSKGGGHLFEIEHLGPPFIAGAFPLEPGLNINSQTDLLARLAGPLAGAGQSGPYIRFAVAVSEGIRTQTGKPFLTGSPEADRSPTLLDLIARLLHQGEKFREIGGPLGKGGINGGPQPVLIGQRPFPSGQPFPVIPKLALASGLGIFHDRQSVFQAQAVREPPQGKGRAPKVAEFPGTVKGRGIVVDVRVNMLLVRVGRDDEGMTALRPAHSQLIAYPVCFFRGDLSGIEGLTDLITQHIFALLLLPARHGLVSGLCQKKLSGYRGRVALIGRYVFPVLRLFRVFPVVQTVTDGLCYALALVGVALQ